MSTKKFNRNDAILLSELQKGDLFRRFHGVDPQPSDQLLRLIKAKAGWLALVMDMSNGAQFTVDRTNMVALV